MVTIVLVTPKAPTINLTVMVILMVILMKLVIVYGFDLVTWVVVLLRVILVHLLMVSRATATTTTAAITIGGTAIAIVPTLLPGGAV